ncbi:hypothetical protein [Chondrinema litorale]|uniref:hypothetical protein n=1 Tax=Chondrinema litorale TaxID=2994555 RepID=UPI0025428102|nr:hypothetical protein [Chondrinema litorale]UZR95683.1 hypothetical protein OQ292_07650 [Chondrinema litorale]
MVSYTNSSFTTTEVTIESVKYKDDRPILSLITIEDRVSSWGTDKPYKTIRTQIINKTYQYSSQ